MNKLETRIGYVFHCKKILKQAFIHSSYSHENRMTTVENNERLEFLGDAVLELTISDCIFKKFQTLTEGDLTKLRAALVCEATIAKKARELDLGEYLMLGKGEISAGGNDKESILADTFEALIGAIYLDGGLENAGAFILRMMHDEIDSKFTIFKVSDYKTYLQEIIQKNSKSPIEYAIVSETGPDHDKMFTVNVIHESKVLGKGAGKSKKEAQQNAALNAIRSLS